jgi:hypothetical protein
LDHRRQLPGGADMKGVPALRVAQVYATLAVVDAIKERGKS